VARKHTLKLHELRRIRLRFLIILAGMAAVTLLILAYLAVRAFGPARVGYLDFFSLCFYAFASFVMTIAQIVFLRQLTVGAGRRIQEMTYTDELTGLGNRRHIAKFLSEEMREAQLGQNFLSLLFIDLDGFKGINDRHGHKAGDLVLRAVGHALKMSVRDVDLIGRAGGDEFVVILPDTDSQCASVVARRINQRLDSISVTVNGEELKGLSASIGISCYPVNAKSRETLLEDADRSMYAAKSAGNGNVVISIARPPGAEPKTPVRGITTLSSRIETIVTRHQHPGSAEQQPAERAEEAADV
jgi:diguanylate cyclase (GGDEF)-like protein